MTIKTLLILGMLVIGYPSQSTAKENYGLAVGDMAPNIDSKDVDGKSLKLSELVSAGPTVLVFYRGGWCPFCNTQLHSLQTNVVPKLAHTHSTLVAISVDKLEEELKTKNKHDLSFRIISDPKAKILEAYKVSYVIPEALVAKYKNEYKIDVEAASGEKHHTIAVPAVYVIDKKGKITYAHVDEDYKKRAPEEEILKAIAAASK